MLLLFLLVVLGGGQARSSGHALDRRLARGNPRLIHRRSTRGPQHRAARRSALLRRVPQRRRMLVHQLLTHAHRHVVDRGSALHAGSLHDRGFRQRGLVALHRSTVAIVFQRRLLRGPVHRGATTTRDGQVRRALIRRRDGRELGRGNESFRRRDGRLGCLIGGCHRLLRRRRSLDFAVQQLQ